MAQRAPAHPLARQGPVDPTNLYVVLTWDRNDPTATGYRVYRDGVLIGGTTDGGGPDDWDKRYLRDTAVLAGRAYQYQVAPMYGQVEGPLSPGAEVLVRANHPDKVFTVTDFAGATLRDKLAAALAGAVASAPTFEQPAVLLFPAGTHTFATDDAAAPTFQAVHNIVVRGASQTGTIVRAGFAGSSNEANIDKSLFKWLGATTNLAGINPAVAVERGERQVTLNDASPFAVGDYLALNEMAGAMVKSADDAENLNPWDVNEIVGKAGDTLYVRYPWAKPFTVAAGAFKLTISGCGIEQLTVEGDGSATQTYYSLLVAESCALWHMAEVRGRWCNRNVLHTRGYKHSLVRCQLTQTDPKALAGESLRYDVTAGRGAHLVILDCDFGDLDRVGSSMVTTQVAHKQIVRHSRFYRSENYGWNEHGAGSFWNVFENNYVYMPEASKGGIFLGNSSFHYSGPARVRGNLFDNCDTAAIAGQQNSWGIRVLDNWFRDCPDDLVNWYGSDFADMAAGTFGSARMALKRNACDYTGADKAARGLVLGYNGGSDPYPGVRDLVATDNELDVDADAIKLGGSSSESYNLQVARNTGKNDYTRPTLVAGDYWADNEDDEDIVGAGDEATPYFADTFSGSAGSSAGWPIYLRSTVTGTGTDFTVSSSGNYGRLSLFSAPAGQRKTVCALRSELMHDSLVLADFRDLSDTVSRIQALVARHAGVNANDNHYRAVYEYAGASNRLRLEKVIGGVATVLAQTTALDADLTADLRVKLEVAGTTIRAKAWLVSGSEPGPWTLTATDSALAEAGRVGVLLDGPDAQTTTSDFDNYKLANWLRNAQEDFGSAYAVAFEADSFEWEQYDVAVVEADIIQALSSFLKADAAVGSLTAARVFGGELPRAEVASMPRAAVVLKPAGGGLLGQGYQDWGDSRVDVDCYGATALAGWQLYLAVHTALKHLRREVAAGVLLHWARASSKGITARDPDTDWPLTVSSWQVLASEVVAA